MSVGVAGTIPVMLAGESRSVLWVLVLSSMSRKRVLSEVEDKHVTSNAGQTQTR